MVGTTGEDFTFRVCVVEEGTVTDEVTLESTEVLEVKKCGDVILAAGIGAFVVVTRQTMIYDGKSNLTREYCKIFERLLFPSKTETLLIITVRVQ